MRIAAMDTKRTTNRRGRGLAAAVRLALALLGGVVAGARAETLTIATYNVENYTSADRMTAEGGFQKDYPKPEAEKAALRAVIRALDADVLALQEMGPAPYLEELRRDLKADGLDYPEAVLLEAEDPDRHLALLSRRPLAAAIRHTELKFEYAGAVAKVKRGLLEVKLATAAGEVTLFVVHLKSRLTDVASDPQSAERRLAEAVAVREAVLAEFPNPEGARFLLVGDCNDDKASKPMQRLLERGKTRIARLLPAADSRGETWTHHYRREDSYARIDHVLVSALLLPAVEGGAARIFDDPAVLAASDHRPVVVRLHL